MEGTQPQSKHRNLRHVLTREQRTAAAALLGADAGPDAAGVRILELRQREMQELFGQIFGVETKSSNNEWLRSKLLQAVGLPPRWRPAPPPPPAPPTDRRPGEYSRFGRRLRATVQELPAGSDSEGDGSPRPAKRARPAASNASTASGASSGFAAGAGGLSRSPPRVPSPVELLPPAIAAPHTHVHTHAAPAALQQPLLSADTAGSGSGPVALLQARASAAHVSYVAHHAPHPMYARVLASVQLPRAPERQVGLAALLSSDFAAMPPPPAVPVPVPALAPAMPPHELVARDGQVSLRLPAISGTISAKLHQLFHSDLWSDL